MAKTKYQAGHVVGSNKNIVKLLSAQIIISRVLCACHKIHIYVFVQINMHTSMWIWAVRIPYIRIWHFPISASQPFGTHELASEKMWVNERIYMD